MIEIRNHDDFQAFLALAKRGDRAIYYRGFLATGGRTAAIRELQEAIHVAKMRDSVVLVQKRIDEGHYEYHVIKT
jgi:hypothetical protein